VARTGRTLAASHCFENLLAVPARASADHAFSNRRGDLLCDKLLIFHDFGAWPMRSYRLFSCIALGLALVAPAHALDRLFPPQTKRGDMSNVDFPTVKIDGAERKLAAGAWIKNENNTIDMPVTLRGRQFTVNYTEDNEGNVNRVWILSPAEASVPLPKQ